MRILAAIAVGLLLFAASVAMLWAAREPLDVLTVAGGTGVVLSGALLGLTLLAWRWRASQGGYVATVVDTAGFYEELAAFDDDDELPRRDAAAG